MNGDITLRELYTYACISLCALYTVCIIIIIYIRVYTEFSINIYVKSKIKIYSLNDIQISFKLGQLTTKRDRFFSISIDYFHCGYSHYGLFYAL